MNARDREAQQQRRQSAADWAEESGGYTPTSFKAPKGLKYYKLTEGIQSFDVIPFLAKYAIFKQPKVDPGQEIWHRTYGRHRIPGPQGKDIPYLCLYETFGVPCPICKKLTDKSLPKEVIDAIRARRRFAMLVNDKPGDQNNPLKILDAVYYNRDVGFGEQLRNSINLNKPHCDYFYDWEQQDGKTLRVMVTDEKWAKVGSISMIPRNYSYPYSMVESAPSLDECFLVPKPKELEDIPLDQLTDQDWRRVYAELDAIVNGDSFSSSSVPTKPPRQEAQQEAQQELPAVSAKPIAPTTPIKNGAEGGRTTSTSAPRAQSQPTQVSSGTKAGCPYKHGDKVVHLGLVCTVKAIEGGRLLTLLDEDGDLHEDVPFAAVKFVGVKVQEKKEEVKPQESKTRKGFDEDDDLDDITEDENG